MTDDKDEWFKPGTAKVNGEIDILRYTVLLKFDWQQTHVADMSLVPFW